MHLKNVKQVGNLAFEAMSGCDPDTARAEKRNWLHPAALHPRDESGMMAMSVAHEINSSGPKHVKQFRALFQSGNIKPGRGVRIVKRMMVQHHNEPSIAGS